MYPGDIPFPGGTGANKAAPGRPKKVGQPIVLKTPDNSSGFEFSAEDPQSLQSAQQKYMKAGQLPPGLQPKRSRPQQNRTNQAISRGWRNPRGLT